MKTMILVKSAEKKPSFDPYLCEDLKKVDEFLFDTFSGGDMASYDGKSEMVWRKDNLELVDIELTTYEVYE